MNIYIYIYTHIQHSKTRYVTRGGEMGEGSPLSFF